MDRRAWLASRRTAQASATGPVVGHHDRFHLVEQDLALRGVERLHPQEVPVRKPGHGRRSRRTTRSPSPRSDSITRTDSLAVVSTATPTT